MTYCTVELDPYCTVAINVRCVYSKRLSAVKWNDYICIAHSAKQGRSRYMIVLQCNVSTVGTVYPRVLEKGRKKF